MFLPRLVKKGMFGDGLLYASIARNMSEGRGSIWQPYFSSSYWLENVATYYYENPPLMLWVESLLFQVTGDHWWVEKLFSLIVLILNVLLIKALWKSYFQDQLNVKHHWPAAILTWYFIPVVIWGNVNNLMDNFLLSFCLMSLICYFKYVKSVLKNRFWWLILVSVFVFLGTLVKGPVALFPIVAPFLYWFYFRKVPFKTMIFETFLIVAGTTLLFGSLLFWHHDAYVFFEQYWQQRLKAVLTGSRGDMKLEGWAKIYIIQQLCLELAPTFFILLLTWIFSKIKSSIEHINNFSKDLLFFASLGFAATLPILLSTKQSGIYLIPGIPMFSFAAAIFLVSIFKNKYIFEWLQINKLFVNLMFLTLWLIVVGFTIHNFGKLRRESQLISDIEQLKNVIPKGSHVSVCDTMMQDFVIHTYMQRMGKYELKSDSIAAPFYLKNHTCFEDRNIIGYSVIDKENFHYFTVYRRDSLMQY